MKKIQGGIEKRRNKKLTATAFFSASSAAPQDMQIAEPEVESPAQVKKERKKKRKKGWRWESSLLSFYLATNVCLAAA